MLQKNIENNVKKLMKLPIVIDDQNIYEKEDLNGFEYYGVGRGTLKLGESIK